MTGNDVFKLAIALVDDILDDGSIDTSTTADYLARSPSLINLYQNELLKTADYKLKYELAYTPLENVLGSQFNITVFDGTDLTYETPSGKLGKAYYFESDAPSGTAYIEHFTTVWNTVTTVTLNATDKGFKAYKGVSVPTALATKSRIRFTGSYYYRTVNRALFTQSFSAGTAFYDYAPWVKVDLPTTCHAIKQIIEEDEYGNYAQNPTHKIEMNGTTEQVYIPYAFRGKIRITFIPEPDLITTMSSTLVIDDYSAKIMAYALASDFMRMEGRVDQSDFFQSKYEQLKNNTQFNKPKQNVQTVNKYGSV